MNTDIVRLKELDRYLIDTNHEAFAHHIISQNKTPISEFISKSKSFGVKYTDNNLILLAIRDNTSGNLYFQVELNSFKQTGQYTSHTELKEEAAPFDIVGSVHCFNEK